MSKIISRRCDVPMARSKKLFPCDRNCKNCVACIERDEDGHESHAIHGGKDISYALLFRNSGLRRLYDDSFH